MTRLLNELKLLAVKTNEQFAIAQETIRIIEEKNKVNTIPTIPIAVSSLEVSIPRTIIFYYKIYLHKKLNIKKIIQII